ncbi:MAG: hypothetical protein AAEJ53_21010 [Myxococcota bacterium]
MFMPSGTTVGGREDLQADAAFAQARQVDVPGIATRREISPEEQRVGVEIDHERGVVEPGRLGGHLRQGAGFDAVHEALEGRREHRDASEKCEQARQQDQAARPAILLRGRRSAGGLGHAHPWAGFPLRELVALFLRAAQPFS